MYSRYSPNWNQESKERFAMLLPEIWAKVSEPYEKLSQDKFGSIFEVSGSTVQSWLKGSIPETPKLKKMASILCWSLDELVYYLEIGDRPSEKSQMHSLIYELNNLPLKDLAILVEAGAKRLAAEVSSSYKVS